MTYSQHQRTTSLFPASSYCVVISAQLSHIGALSQRFVAFPRVCRALRIARGLEATVLRGRRENSSPCERTRVRHRSHGPSGGSGESGEGVLISLELLG